MLKTQAQLPELDFSPDLQTSETLTLLNPEWRKNPSGISFAIFPFPLPDHVISVAVL